MDKELDEILEKNISCLVRIEADGNTYAELSGLNQAHTAIINLMKSLVPELETRFLTKDRLQYQMGWCEGRKSFREEMLRRIDEKR